MFNLFILSVYSTTSLAFSSMALEERVVRPNKKFLDKSFNHKYTVPAVKNVPPPQETHILGLNVYFLSDFHAEKTGCRVRTMD